MKWNQAVAAAVATAALPVAASAASNAPAPKAQLAPPVAVQADGKPIDITEVGHAAPFHADVDGDGKRDLLVGQFGGGKMKVYKNHGSDTAPTFKALAWFEAAGEVVTTPTG
jgi:hypothetical protein